MMMQNETFFPDVKIWFEDPGEHGPVIGEKWTNQSPALEASTEFIPFGELMDSLAIPADIFCNDVIKIPELGKDVINARTIVYLRPVMSHYCYIDVPLGDLEFKEIYLPVNNGRVLFPLTIIIRESARHRFDANRFYRTFNSLDDFMNEFLVDLAFLHDAGYRVAFFEEREPITDVRAVLSDRGKVWLEKLGNDVVFDDEIERRFKKIITSLNKFRPKGTYFTKLYTINMQKYPIYWDDDRLGNRDYKRLVKEFTLPGSLNDEYKNYLEYLRYAMKEATFEFTDDDAFKKMMINSPGKWGSLIKIFNDNQKKGVPQDVIAKGQGVSQMTICRWTLSVKGEIARLRGDAYEKFLEKRWTSSGNWKVIQRISGNGKPDFLRFNLDGSIDVVSVKCHDTVRLETSLITDEDNKKCEIKPELMKVKELLVAGERARLIFHFFNYSSKFCEERVINPFEIPSNLTFKEKKPSRKREKFTKTHV